MENKIAKNEKNTFNEAGPKYHEDPAFPVPDAYTHKGVTQFQFFFRAALQGLLSRPTVHYDNNDTIIQRAAEIARLAVTIKH